MSRLLGFVDRILAVCFAFLFMQFPIFLQQYQLRLAGHLEELKLQVGNIDKLAISSGKTLAAFIQKFIDNPDVDFSRQGELMANMVIRLNDLNMASSALQESFFLLKPFVFIRWLDYDIAQEAIRSYQIGLVFTYETICYALLGIGVSYGICFFSSIGKKKLPFTAT